MADGVGGPIASCQRSMRVSPRNCLYCSIPPTTTQGLSVCFAQKSPLSLRMASATIPSRQPSRSVRMTRENEGNAKSGRLTSPSSTRKPVMAVRTAKRGLNRPRYAFRDLAKTSTTQSMCLAKICTTFRMRMEILKFPAPHHTAFIRGTFAIREAKRPRRRGRTHAAARRISSRSVRRWSRSSRPPEPAAP